MIDPFLFLSHINDLPSVAYSKVRLFADGWLIYREINAINDQNDLQIRELNYLQAWASDGGMRFIAKKCIILNKVLFNYSLRGEILNEVPDTKYLGI